MTKETSSKTMVHGKYNQQRTTSQEAEIIIQISPSPLLVAKIYNEKKNSITIIYNILKMNNKDKMLCINAFQKRMSADNKLKYIRTRIW